MELLRTASTVSVQEAFPVDRRALKCRIGVMERIPGKSNSVFSSKLLSVLANNSQGTV